MGWISIFGEGNEQLSHNSHSILIFKDRVRGILPVDRAVARILGCLICMGGEMAGDMDIYIGFWVGSK